jgi:hypothetical protein
MRKRSTENITKGDISSLVLMNLTLEIQVLKMGGGWN